jgi:predicted HAD superfamily phosphohydrolase
MELHHQAVAGHLLEAQAKQVAQAVAVVGADLQGIVIHVLVALELVDKAIMAVKDSTESVVAVAEEKLVLE